MEYTGKIDFAAAVQPHCPARPVPPIELRPIEEDRSLNGGEIAKLASALLAQRRKRFAFFDSALFADPAWDVLLVLTIAECRQQRMTVSRLCERVGSPMTTTLRWIGTMQSEGLLVRRDDTTDKRRKFIELSPGALKSMIEYLSPMAPSLALAA